MLNTVVVVFLVFSTPSCLSLTEENFDQVYNDMFDYFGDRDADLPKAVRLCKEKCYFFVRK